MTSSIGTSGKGLYLTTLVLVLACTGGGPRPSTINIAPESTWSALNRPRPEPVEGAVRVSVSEITVLTNAWQGTEEVTRGLGLQELVAAGLLRRRDVRYVERRRFAAAVERETRGLPAAQNAPAAGNSAGAEFILTGAWAATGDSATLSLRLVDAETGDVRSTWRTSTPTTADPTSVARLTAGGLVAALRTLGRLPDWSDPIGGAAPEAFLASGVPLSAAQAFFDGLAAEERFDWEAARRGYQLAIEISTDFFEAEMALARVARLRAGGTLGATE